MEMITVGKLGKARGVNGEMWVTPLTDFPERFVGMKEIYVGRNGQWEKTVMVSARMISGRPVIGLGPVTSPEEVARWTNRELAVPRQEVVELPADTFYVFDLVGCAVYDEGSGEVIGEVTDIETYPANDVYLIRMVEGGECKLPAIRQFVKLVDTAQRKIIVAAEGLFADE